MHRSRARSIQAIGMALAVAAVGLLAVSGTDARVRPASATRVDAQTPFFHTKSGAPAPGIGDVEMLTAKVGFALGGGSKVFKTVDGGVNWQQQ